MKTKFLLFPLLILSFAFFWSFVPSASAIDTTVRYNIEVVGSPYTYIWVDGDGPLKFSGQIYFDLDGLEPHSFVVSEAVCPSEESGEGFRDWRNGVRYVALECSWNAEAGTISTTYSGYLWYDPTTCSWIWIPQQSYSFNPPPNSHTFEYTREYRLVIEDKYQAPVSGPQWYKEGSVVDLPTPASTTIYLQEGVRVTFDGWEIDDSGSTASQVTMNSPHKATAKYITEYRLDVASEIGTASGSGWYQTGQVAKMSITPEMVPMESPWGLLGAKYRFDGWSGSEDLPANPTVAVTMNGPLTYTARWCCDVTLTVTVVCITVIIVVVCCCCCYYLLRRRRWMEKPAEKPRRRFMVGMRREDITDRTTPGVGGRPKKEPKAPRVGPIESQPPYRVEKPPPSPAPPSQPPQFISPLPPGEGATGGIGINYPCPKCGWPIPVSDQFCSRCGSPRS